MDQVHKMNDDGSKSRNEVLDTALFFEQFTEFPVFYRHYSRGQNRSPMVPNLSQINAFHNLPAYFTKIYSNFNFPSMSKTS